MLAALCGNELAVNALLEGSANVGQKDKARKRARRSKLGDGWRAQSGV
jgi:hypothetical protein